MTSCSVNGGEQEVSLLVRLWVEILILEVLSTMLDVSLLVRLWVEIWLSENRYPHIHSQPPCEAVSWNTNIARSASWGVRQPPCEAVSWNAYQNDLQSQNKKVSLLVRLWVEISMKDIASLLIIVSLLVRLWVEIIVKVIGNYLALVSLLVRLWVEIPMCVDDYIREECQPPCEAVSWNSG